MVQIELQKKNFAIVLKGVQEIDAKVLAVLPGALKQSLEYASGVAQRFFLSGPRPYRLGIVSGRLRNSITVDVQPNADGTGVAGRFGSNVVYAKFHEFGFEGVIQVRGHTRVMGVIGKTGKTLPGRVPIRELGGIVGFNDKGKAIRERGRIVGYRDRKTDEQRLGLSGFGSIQVVKAHSREIRYKGRPFLRPALQDAMPIILETLEDEIQRVKFFPDT